MASKKYQPIELTFKVAQSEADTFDRIKGEMGVKNGAQVLRRLLYLWDDLKWKKTK